MQVMADDLDLNLEQNAHIKPSYSYAQLIGAAIYEAEGEALSLAGIYQHIMNRFSYYRVPHNIAGWQVSSSRVMNHSLANCNRTR